MILLSLYTIATILSLFFMVKDIHDTGYELGEAILAILMCFVPIFNFYVLWVSVEHFANRLEAFKRIKAFFGKKVGGK